MLIRDVIRDREPYSVRATASVIEAAEFMAQRKIGAVCVLDDEGKNWMMPIIPTLKGLRFAVVALMNRNTTLFTEGATALRLGIIWSSVSPT
jgi:CBS domain-containing protein